ncbi:TetR/AcrR family transcriptional regulator [Janthinobacterium sp.]|uniref:TetR/AcrR family transcriptional regulator n=1 Tax=Janthinobacterium sp. TaxID=1871054 RepID=UPI00258AD427|nr:TetR/AcrR family transcriptional regulator [Janthinobacterium sp.]MCX7294352.1 TetR family transcriptional regulator [Janthinobacterium sp.]
MLQKAPRRTRERILELSLRLFNEFGDPTSRCCRLSLPPKVSRMCWLYAGPAGLMFELIWRYRFFYRDLNDLLSRNRKLELHFKLILAHKIKVATQLCEDLRSEQSLEASDMEVAAMATNMVVVATYWLSYEYVRNPRKYSEQQSMSDALARGCYQVLSLIGPYLRNETHLLFRKLSEEYVTKLKND